MKAITTIMLVSSLALGCVPEGAEDFGKLSDGSRTYLYRLVGKGGLTIDVADYGGRVVRVLAPDAKGELADVTMGWNTAAEYEKNGFCAGTLIGRFGNRIKDGRFSIDGTEYRLPLNETKPEPRHCNLHSGPHGLDRKIWDVRRFTEGDTVGIELTCTAKDGEDGFPGNLKCSVTYRVTPENVWSIDYRAETDKPTVVNLTHHSYWNLAGEASGDVLDQHLQIFADSYTKTDAGLIPIADAPVEGTGFDFRAARKIGSAAEWMAAQADLKCTDNWYDHNFRLRGEPGVLKPAVRMSDPKSRRVLEIFTTEPCLQVYGAQNLDGTLNAKAPGKKLPKCAAIALETQHYPDSPNHPEFPSTVLRPGQVFTSRTEYRFSALH